MITGKSTAEILIFVVMFIRTKNIVKGHKVTLTVSLRNVISAPLVGRGDPNNLGQKFASVIFVKLKAFNK